MEDDGFQTSEYENVFLAHEKRGEKSFSCKKQNSKKDTHISFVLEDAPASLYKTHQGVFIVQEKP